MAFGATVGDTPLAKAFVGTTPVIRTYVGDKHVWPPFSSRVTYVGSQVFTGTTSVNFPTHTPNDLLVIYAVGGGAPVAPAGWTDVPTGQSGNPAGTLAYKWATSTSASTGAWSGNAAGVMYVFRGVDQVNPFGTVGTSLGSTAGTVVTAPAITLTDPSGGSAVAHNYYHDGTSGSWVNKAPANFIVKNLNARMASTIAIDTAAVDATSLTHSQSAKWRSLAFEIKAPITVTVTPKP